MGKKEIAKAINTVTLPLNHHGTCAMVQIGNTGMESSAIVKNLIHVNEVLERRYPGGWKNIRAQHIKTESSTAIPIYANTLPTNEVGFVDAAIPKKAKRENITGELSTIPGIEVTITPSGNIKVVKTADPEWDDEKDEAFVDASEDDEEKKIEEKETEKKSKKRKNKKEETSQNKKSKTNDSDSDDDIQESEKTFLKKVARKDAEKPDTANDAEESDAQGKEDNVSASEDDSGDEGENSEIEESSGDEEEDTASE